MKNNNPDVLKRFVSKGVFPYQYAFTLLIPLRNIFLSPKQLINRLMLKENYTVLEIGPGPGYFSIKIAKELSKGKLVLADIQQKMLDYARKRIEKKGLKNVEFKLCSGETLDFENDYFDRVFMVTVIGEIEKKDEYLKEIYRVLKKGGILSISELAGDPDKIEKEDLRELIEPKGFKLTHQFGSNKNYTLNFTKI
ncbi:MAG: methyltransferase domain-containing protein [Bacteroidetes bacterium]|nr:methyltransferase domain-containing protein [Bacteroidota bacterium]